MTISLQVTPGRLTEDTDGCCCVAGGLSIGTDVHEIRKNNRKAEDGRK